ncbi:two-component system OmpR family sensor kinase [Rhodoligotrophos appendicifer]|uniref:sensor histidine kinase n=1 Tax=Rhodoligotrophos appendicifer TaxID=987056 RepID=UPI001185D186|nr:ATP-binding protein [Rhodoligotrophos appendicifer]
MRQSSISRSLILWLTAGSVLFWVFAAALSTYVMQHEFDEVFDSALQEAAERLMPLVLSNLRQQSSAGLDRRIGDGTPSHDEVLTYQVKDPEGRVLMRSHDASSVPFDVALATGFADSSSHRIYTESTVDRTIFLQVADPLTHRREAVIESATTLVLPILGLAPFSVIVIFLIVRRTVAPIAALRREIGLRGGSNLMPLPSDSLPTELAAIAGSVDMLLDRLRSALEAERQFSSNAAHELRTPIAGALAQVQRLAVEMPQGRGRERAKEIEAALIRLSRLSEKLLQLSRAEAGLGMSATEIDVLPIIRLVARDFEPSSAVGTQLRLELPAAAKWKVDADAFAIILRNLIENALRHGDGAEPVVIRMDENGVLTVTNAGPVLPADELRRIIRRHQHASILKGGAGLGLAIVDVLVTQMGAVIEYYSPRRNAPDGFEVRLALPGA